MEGGDNSSVDHHGSSSTLIESIEQNTPPPVPFIQELPEQLEAPSPPPPPLIPRQPPSSSSSSSSSSSREADNFDDDPLHDEHNDSDNEKWLLENVFHSNDNDSSTSTGGGDRVSCPRCFVTLSLQTQKHVTYEGQFRALFVRNCRIDERCTASVNVRQRQRQRESDTEREMQLEAAGGNKGKSDLVDVLCEQCETRVGVKEKSKGIYHFCNVMY